MPDLNLKLESMKHQIHNLERKTRIVQAKTERVQAELDAKCAECRRLTRELAELKTSRQSATDGYVLNATIVAEAPEGTYHALKGKGLQRYQVDKLVQHAKDLKDVLFAAGVPLNSVLPHLTNHVAMLSTAVKHIKDEAVAKAAAKQISSGDGQLNEVKGNC